MVRHPATEPLASLAPGDTLLAPAAAEGDGSSVRWPRRRPRLAWIAGSVLGLVGLGLGVLAAVPAIADKPEPQQLVQAEPEPQGLTPLAVTQGRWPEAVSLASAAASRQPALRRVPGCEAALASALAELPVRAVRRCSRNTGVTTGDPMTLRLGRGASGKLEVKVLASSGSRDFDGCLAQALAQRHLPTTKPTRCQRVIGYRVP